MAIPIETLVVQLRADVKGLQSGLAKATKTTQASSAKMSKAAGTVGLAFKSMLAPLIGVAGVTLAIRKLKGLADSMDRLAKLAIKIGIDVGALSELEFVAERSGIAFRSMAMALQRSSVAIAEAAEGTGEAKQAIEDLELSAKDLIKIPIDRQLEVIADAFLKVENDSKRSQLAVDIFGARGAALLQAMRTGGKGIREIRKEARDFNLTIGKKAAEDAEAFADAISDLGASFTGLGRAIVASGLPASIKVIDSFVKSITTLVELRKNLKIVREEEERLAKANQFLGDNFVGNIINLRNFKDALINTFKVAVPGFKGVDAVARLLTFRFLGGTKAVKAQAEEIERLKATLVTAAPIAGGDGEESFFKKFTDGFKAVQKQGKISFGEVTRDVEINTQAWADAFTDSLLKGKAGFDDFKNFAISAIGDIVKEMFKAQVIAPLFNQLIGGALGAFGGTVNPATPAAGATSGGFSGIGGFSVGQAGGLSTVTARAHGGNLDRGQASIIGEKGPEIFIPKVSGTVIPNNKLGGGGGVNITQNFNISPGLEETVQAKIEEAAPFIAESAKTAVFQAIEKGGGASRSVGRRA